MSGRATLPFWPRRMTAPVAAAYLSVSPSKFSRGVLAGTYPKGHKDGGNTLWDKADLDRWVDEWAASSSGPRRLKSW